MPSRDVAADVGFFTEVLGGRLVFAIDGMGTRVAMIELTDGPPQLLLAGHLEGDRPVLVYRVADLDAATHGPRVARLDGGSRPRDPAGPGPLVRGAGRPPARDLRADPSGRRRDVRRSARLLGAARTPGHGLDGRHDGRRRRHGGDLGRHGRGHGPRTTGSARMRSRASPTATAVASVRIEREAGAGRAGTRRRSGTGRPCWGRHTCGTPWAMVARNVPDPVCDTTAAQRGRTWVCGT